MLDVIEKASMESKEFLILGDLNSYYKIDVSLSDNLWHIIESLYLLIQLIETPTSVATKSSKHIDVILSSCSTKHKLSDVAKIILSDHYFVYNMYWFKG